MPRSLDLVVTSVATQLMEATAASAGLVSEKVLAQLVEQFDVDASFLRYLDPHTRASALVAEWPARTDAADPDPNAFAQLDIAESVLAQCGHGRKPVVIRPAQSKRFFRRRAGATKVAASPSVAAAPLVSGETTTGLLGFVKFGARKWEVGTERV